MTEQDWLAMQTADEVYGVLAAVVQQRKLFLLGCAYLRRVWPLLTEASPDAVEVTERYAAGRAGARDLLEAWTRAEAGMGDELWLAPDAEEGEDHYDEYVAPIEADLPQQAVWPGVRAGFRDPAWFASRAVRQAVLLARDSARPDRRAQAGEAERREQYRLYLDIIGDPCQPAVPAPPWAAGPAVRRLVEHLDRADPDPLGWLALADALEEAGCADRAVLEHCRGPARHFRGCWVAELLQGRMALRLPVDDEVIWPYDDRRSHWFDL